MIVESIIIGSILGLMILIIVDLKDKLNKQREISSYRTRVIDALERENVKINNDTIQLLEIIRSFNPVIDFTTEVLEYKFAGKDQFRETLLVYSINGVEIDKRMMNIITEGRIR